MISIEITCAMCGKQLRIKNQTSFSLNRADDKPHYDFERDIKRIIYHAKWIYQDNVCGDIYCSEKCAE